MSTPLETWHSLLRNSNNYELEAKKCQGLAKLAMEAKIKPGKAK